METIAIDRRELKKIIHETFVDVLISRKDLIGDAVLEAIEDLGLAKAMETGQAGEYVDVDEFKKSLKKKFKRSK